jgi:hypothetical protein
MFKFLMGVAFGAAGYWAWQSFGRDLLGMGDDQETSYGGFTGGTPATSGLNSSAPASSGTNSTTPSTPTPSSTTNPTSSKP